MCLISTPYGGIFCIVITEKKFFTDNMFDLSKKILKKEIVEVK